MEVFLGKSTAPSNFLKESLDLRRDQGKPNARGMNWGNDKEEKKEDTENKPLGEGDQRMVSGLEGIG